MTVKRVYKFSAMTYEFVSPISQVKPHFTSEVIQV
jgi:hypothetical protein